MKDAYEMDGSGPSEELQEVEEELRKSKGDGKEQEQDEDGMICDVEKGSSSGQNGNSTNNSSISKGFMSCGADNLKVFTQVGFIF